ncbi:hypothetical protein GOODEAATRI_034079, partial [Goodea atripinnis]
DINLDSLSANINSKMDIHNVTTLDELVSHYNTGLRSVLDSLAPLKTKSVSFSCSAPWFTSSNFDS